MTAELSAAELAAIKGRHRPGRVQTGGPLCTACSSYSNAVYWPCNAVRLCDALAAAWAENADLKRQVRQLETRLWNKLSSVDVET